MKKLDNKIEREKCIIENFAKVYNKIKRIDESEISELSPELRQRASKKAEDDYFKSKDSHDELQAQKRIDQAEALAKVYPNTQKEADEIAKYVMLGGSAKLQKIEYIEGYGVILIFSNDKGDYLQYNITKDNVIRSDKSNMNPEPNVGRRIQRFIQKLRNTEISNQEE